VVNRTGFKTASTSKTAILFLLAAVGILSLFASSYRYTMDDALITLRYSQNLAESGRPIWNKADADSPTMGFTSPAWMVLNSVQALFSSNKDSIITGSKLWSLAFLLAFAWVIVSVIARQQIGLPAGLLFTALLLWNPIFAFHACSGMETILFSTALVLYAVLATRAADYKLMLFLGMLLYIIRPEGIVAAGLYWLFDLVRHKNVRKSILGLLVIIVFLGCYHIIVFRYYGHLLPSVFYLKQAGGPLLKSDAIKLTIAFLLFAALPFILFFFSIRKEIRTDASIFASTLAAMYLLYYLTVFPIMNAVYRYQLPVLSLLILVAACHLQAFQKQRRIYRYPIIIMILLVGVFNMGFTGKYTSKVGQADANRKALGLFMKQYNNYQDWLMYHDAGYVCFYSDFNTIDTNGLNTIDIATKKKTKEDYLAESRVKYYFHNARTSDLHNINIEDTALDYGFSYIGAVPISYDGIEYYVVKIYDRGGRIMRSDLQHVAVNTEVKKTWFDDLYYRGRAVIKGR
jgi:arabinofuranosyltransferase